MRKEAKILLAIAAVVLAGGIVLFFNTTVTPQEIGAPADSQSLVRESSQMTGKTGAKATIVEFADFQCPACAYAAPIIKQVVEAYKTNPEFNFVFRHYPLPQHKNAMLAAEAAEAAGAQDKFWDMLEKIYAGQSQWSENSGALEIFSQYANELGLDLNAFKTEVQGKKYERLIRADLTDGDSLGVNSTPTFYFNGTKQDHILTFDEWQKQIDDALKK